MSNEHFLGRLIAGLDAAGIKKYGRNKRVAEKTGYSPGAVANALSGHVALTDRLIQAICTAFHIRKEWIYEGIEPIRGIELGGTITGTSQVAGDLTVTGWNEKKEVERTIKRLQDEREEISNQIAELKEKKEKIESDFIKYHDLIVAFMYIPVEEMDEAIDVLRIVQKTTADNPNLPDPLK